MITKFKTKAGNYVYLSEKNISVNGQSIYNGNFFTIAHANKIKNMIDTAYAKGKEDKQREIKNVIGYK